MSSRDREALEAIIAAVREERARYDPLVEAARAVIGGGWIACCLERGLYPYSDDHDDGCPVALLAAAVAALEADDAD